MSLCGNTPTIGNWSCSGPGCLVGGGPIVGQVIGANATLYSRNLGSFTAPIWYCDFTGTIYAGDVLQGSYVCEGYAGRFTGPWTVTACR
jgi:LytS/YehU family sensor histidine kinase